MAACLKDEDDARGVADVVHREDEGEAGQSLRQAVERLRIGSDAETDVGRLTAGAADDSGRVCHLATQGPSLASDDFSNYAREQESSHTGTSRREDKVHELLQAGPQVLGTEVFFPSEAKVSSRDVSKYDEFHCSWDSPATSVAAGAKDEEDWESLPCELPAPCNTIPKTVIKEVQSTGKSAIKQRGRGLFTNGAMGLYSDYDLNVTEDAGRSSNDCDDCLVLVLDCSTKVTTKDVEDVVEPFSKEGTCVVRWVDNTRALATFSSPTMAREALGGINDGRFKVRMLSETDVVPGSEPTNSETSVPPASSAQAARRMIVSALSKQLLSKALRTKNKGSLQEFQEQERQRKLRLQVRAQLRDDAWGSDDD